MHCCHLYVSEVHFLKLTYIHVYYSYAYRQCLLSAGDVLSAHVHNWPSVHVVSKGHQYQTTK